MVGLVIVSHSRSLAEGVVELAQQMARDYQGLKSAGGMEDGSLGTDALRIMEAMREANEGDGVAVLADMGSGVLSAETAIELLDGEFPARIADAPLVEGAVSAAVEASCGASLDEVVRAAEDAKGVSKLS